MKLVFLDTETTGLSPINGDRIVEIAAVKVCDAGDKDPLVFHKYINPERLIPAEVVRIHGINNAKVSGEPTFVEIAVEFLDFIEGCTLVIHNAPFDLGFLQNELQLCGLPSLKKMQVIDTLSIARAKYPQQRNNLNALSERLGIDCADRTLRSALFDAHLLVKIYFAMDADGSNITTVQHILPEDKEKDQADDQVWNLSEPINENMTLRVGDYEVELGAEFQQCLAEVIPDYPAYNELFGILAKSHNTVIRNSVASKENLSEETVSLLLNDSDFEVVLSAIETDLGKIFVTNEQLLRVIHNAPRKVVIRVMEIFDGCVQVDHEEIAKAIFDLGDPSIGIACATSWACADVVQKSLVCFEDKDISSAAQS